MSNWKDEIQNIFFIIKLLNCLIQHPYMSYDTNRSHFLRILNHCYLVQSSLCSIVRHILAENKSLNKFLFKKILSEVMQNNKHSRIFTILLSVNFTFFFWSEITASQILHYKSKQSSQVANCRQKRHGMGWTLGKGRKNSCTYIVKVQLWCSHSKR